MGEAQQFNITVFASLAGAALFAVGLGIHYAYGQVKGPPAGGHAAPAILVRLFTNFTRAATGCLVLGAVIVATALALGPALPATGAGITIPVSLYYTAALGLLLALLTCNVLHHRVRSLLASGNRNDATAERIARVHGNFTEYAPVGLLLVFALEWTGAPAAMVHFGGAVLTLARYLHAWGYTRNEGVSLARILGIQGTLFALAYLVVACVYFLCVG